MNSRKQFLKKSAASMKYLPLFDISTLFRTTKCVTLGFKTTLVKKKGTILRIGYGTPKIDITIKCMEFRYVRYLIKINFLRYNQLCIFQMSIFTK